MDDVEGIVLTVCMSAGQTDHSTLSFIRLPINVIRTVTELRLIICSSQHQMFKFPPSVSFIRRTALVMISRVPVASR